MEQDGKKINLVLWDLGGEDRFRFLQPNLIRGAVAALVFFDMSRIMTLIQIKDWVSIIRENTLPHIPILLIGGKVDLADEERQKIVVKDAYGLAKELNLTGYIATSSKSGQNVQESMHKLVSILLEQLKR
jgi:small GTP-binding protein